MLISGAGDRTVRLWNVNTRSMERKYRVLDWIGSVAPSPKGDVVAAGTGNGSIHIWYLQSDSWPRILEGHKKQVLSVSFSPQGEILASKSADGTIKIWRCESWTEILSLTEPGKCLGGLAFNPRFPILASQDDDNNEISLWDLRTRELLHSDLSYMSTQCNTSKVVLVGDSGTGKSCLAHSLPRPLS